MSYTEIKERNGKKYYYRVVSVRYGENVQKKREYLGVDLNKEELELKEREADEKLNNSDKKNEKTARKNLLRKNEEKFKGKVIRGYDFNEGVNYENIIKGYGQTGYQASHFAKAIGIINEMIDEKAFIFLGYTSNMVSSGLREVFRYLVEHRKVNVIVTTAGGIEEDFIKCLGDFYSGDFKGVGRDLREKGINRIGNIYAPNDRYVEFEKWVQPVLEEVYNEQKKTGKIITPSELIWKMGERINDKRSIYYWAWKNKIPIYCPAITDGALGDNVYFSYFKHPDVKEPASSLSTLRTESHYSQSFKIDIVRDVVEFNNLTIGLKKSGILILGSGIVKHSILNANMLRNGADYSVYINNSQEFDGSDAGAMPDEAVSWGKLKAEGKSVKVFGDATILFPLMVGESFAKK
ncbi:MAG: deoxyhypusine synthase [Nanoarchaeota archaeon]